MYQVITVNTTMPYSAPPPPAVHTVHISHKYVVACADGSRLIFHDVHKGVVPLFVPPGLPVVTTPEEMVHYIDPITAVWLGLVTLADLKLSEQTLAVLKLTISEATP